MYDMKYMLQEGQYSNAHTANKKDIKITNKVSEKV